MVWAVEHWIYLILFMSILVILIRNVWCILIRQSKWRSIPLLYFYIMSFITVVARIIACICAPDLNSEFQIIDSFTASFAKMCSGMSQCWITLTIALRLRLLNKYESLNFDVTIAIEKLDKVLKIGQIVLVISCTLYFIAFVSYMFTDKYQDKPFDLVPKALGWSSMVVFFLMGVTNIMLFQQMKRQKEDLKKEACTLLVILICYELDYLIKFLDDESLLGISYNAN